MLPYLITLPVMSVAARLIRKARQDAGFTLAELARRAGTSTPTISRYENGLVDPRSETLVRLLRACGCELNMSAVGLPVSMSDIGRRFDHQPGPTPDDVTRTTDGRELRTADDVIAFVAELRAEGLLVG